MSVTTEQHQATIFDQIIRQRRAVRVYQEGATISDGVVRRSLERAILAPNSSNLQTWGFVRVHTEAMKAKVARLCLNQSAARTANELLVVVVRGDKWREHSQRVLAHVSQSFSDPMTKRDKRAVEYYRRNIPLLYMNDPLGAMTLFRRCLVFIKSLQGPFIRWTSRASSRIIAHKSAALAAQTFMLSMEAEGYQTCPMEGFDEVRMKKLLDIPRKAEINMVIAMGVGEDQGVYSERFRFPLAEVLNEV